ncbi:SDR family NAD(P)-dependent oxidoreductase, partial [Bradyrhizobium sp.]|uniref:SDR family NAD(P)-dependent oxidoreductase n=1 Tax=Bradyrhizobium sp. TaxID=376 RepID=UPI003BAF7607
MGVVHGLRSFVPRMLAQKEESYIVNTASAAGLLAPAGSGVYAASKHAVVAITECLHHELRGQNAPIGVSVLCPAFVDTGISNSERNRPAELADSNPEPEQYSDRIRQAIKSGTLSAADIARITIDAVKDGRFYILTHPNVKIAVEIRMNDILLDRQPTNTSPFPQLFIGASLGHRSRQSRMLCWFLDAGNKKAPRAQLTGVQKAPRHEVAGSLAPAKQRALWG